MRTGIHCGFTMVELVVIIIVLGILAALAAPRFAGNTGFEERGFRDEVMTALRFAQKAAIAQRRLTCVSFTATTVTVTIASAPPETSPAPTSCDTDLAGPNGTTPYVVTAKKAAQFSPAPVAPLTFKSSGQPSGALTLSFSDLALTVTVEDETGYVH